MIRQENPNFVASHNAPNPLEVAYWIDLQMDSTGKCIKTFNGKQWELIKGGSTDGQLLDITQLQAEIKSVNDEVSSLTNSKVDKTTYELFKTESVAAHNNLNSTKAAKATTLSGYGITDAYTKAQTDTAIQNGVATLVNGAPETLNTLDELSAALADDPNFATTITTLIGTKANSADVYTKSACDSAITTAIGNANKVTSTEVTSIKVVNQVPAVQETGVLYLVTE